LSYNTELITALRLGKPGSTEQNEVLLPLVALGDDAARKRMINGNVALVCARVECYIRLWPVVEYLRDDMTSAGIAGLCEAVNKIVDGHPVTYATGYLSYWINWRIRQLVAREMREALLSDEQHPVVASEKIARDDPSARMLELRELIYSCCETEQDRQLIELRDKGTEIDEIARLLGVSRATLYRSLKRIETRFEHKCSELNGQP
jgi:RNA polymerase sigma factor (sigma-70 family)